MNFNLALDSNDFAGLETAEKELDRAVFKQLRRLKYKGYPTEQMDKLLSELPEDYAGAGVNAVLDILDRMSPAQRATC